MSNDFFTNEVSEILQAYVYRLIDPRNQQTFYVGKGRGNRVFQHAKFLNGISSYENDLMPPKLDRIRQIIESGHSVEYVIHRHGLTDDIAFHVESALIDAYPSLHNEVRGHHAEKQGIATVEQLQQRYNLPPCELDSNHKLLLIKINKVTTHTPEEIYRLTHYCWRLNKHRAETADYILAVDRGVIVDAFVAIEWLPATRKNFEYLPYADDTESHRWGFYGASAPKEIREQYVGDFGKRPINVDLKSQSPVRFVNC